MSDTQNCPDVTRLQALLDGTLPEEVQAAMATHMESCAHCRRQLELLAGGDGLVASDLASAEHRSPALEQAMLRLKGEFTEETVTVGGTSPGPLSFNFLTQSDNPRHLGRLGGYEILELIGRGGMGIVFKGRDRKLERLVAVKVLSPELASSAAARKRFMREAQAAAAVTHEHVVTIHAVDEADGTPFLVMEYIVGVSLEDRIQRTGHLRVEEILRIGMQAASGLAAAHAQGLVHRDIKPSNILLENGVERVKITDFGLARVIHEAQSTQSNVFAGTPPYMSPEQARGESVDHRSDLFSMGCVLYAMCVGRSPFRAETPMGAIHRVCEDTPRPIREMNPDIPDWLVAVIDTLLEKKPEHRFQSAEQVASLLGGYLAHVQQPSRSELPAFAKIAKSSGDTRSIPAWWRWAATAACAFLVLAGAVAFFGRSNSQVTTLPPAASRAGSEPAKVSTPGPRFHFVDFQQMANRFLTQPAESKSPQNNLAQLRPGVLDANGVTVQIGGRYIQLGGILVPECPNSMKGIEVNHHAGKLHFLHGCIETPPHGATVATYTIHYEDGSEEPFPVISGRHLQDWWNRYRGLPRHATRATTGWSGSNPAAAESNAQIELFLCSWLNPHPDKQITFIDFDRGPLKAPAPFCVAITCDEDRSSLPEEPGLVSVHINKWALNKLCSVSITGHSDTRIQGEGIRDVLLAPGQYTVEIRNDETVMRRGSIKVLSGERVHIQAWMNTDLLPLPDPQPDPKAELLAQGSGIFDVAASSDGKTLATAAGDGTVVLWTSTSDGWVKHHALQVDSKFARSIALSPTDKVLATAGEGGTLSLWNSESGRLLATLRDGKAGVSTVAFSPNGRSLISGNSDGTIEFWDVGTHQKIASLAAHKYRVSGIAISPDGKILATAALGDNLVKLWDTASRQAIRSLMGHTDSVTSVVFNPDGKTIASASKDTSVKIWDVQSGDLVKSFSTPDTLNDLAFSSSGKRLAAGGNLQTIHVWDLASNAVVCGFHGHWSGINSVVFAADDNTLVTAGWDNLTRIWSAAKFLGTIAAEFSGPEPRTTFRVHTDWSMCAAFSHKVQGVLAAAAVTRSVRIWNLQDLAFPAALPGTQDRWMANDSLLFTPNDDTLFTCMGGANQQVEVKMWETGKYRLRATLKPAESTNEKVFRTARMALSRDGTAVAVTIRGEGLVTVMTPTSGSPRWSNPSVQGEPACSAFSPDGSTVAVGTTLGFVTLLDAESGKPRGEPLQHGTESVEAVAFSPDGKTLASVATDGVAKLWDLSSSQGLSLPQLHNEKLTSVAFCPDGRLLVTTGGASISDEAPWTHQGEICIWNVSTKELLTKFTAHYGSVTCGVFSPDGKSLATTGRDGKMHLWDVEELLKWQEKKDAT